MSLNIILQGHFTPFSWRWKEFNYSKVKFESRSITNSSNFSPAPNFPHSSVISEKFTSSLWTSRSQTWGELLENKLNHIIPVHSFTQYVSTNRIPSILATQFEYQQKREKVYIQHNLTVNIIFAKIHKKNLELQCTSIWTYYSIKIPYFYIRLYLTLLDSIINTLIALRLFNLHIKYPP